jgi:hypothetical protein
MSEIIFTYKGLDTLIQCQNEEKVNDAINRFIHKTEIDINSIYFIYGGSIVNKELTINELIKSSDKNVTNFKLVKAVRKKSRRSVNYGEISNKNMNLISLNQNNVINKINDNSININDSKH